MTSARPFAKRRWQLAATAACMLLTAGPALASDAAHDAAHDAGHGAAAHGAHGHEHFSLFSMLVPNDKLDHLKASLGEATGMDHSFIDHEPFVQAAQLGPIFWALVAIVFLVVMASMARGKLAADDDAGVMPTRSIGPLLFFEVAVGAVYGMMKDMMGAEEARRYFPIVGTLAVYILTMNLIGLLPLGAPPTDNLNTNLAMGLTVFFATHYAGIRANGLGHYAAHFLGPVMALAPLMLVIEIISHLVRPASLSLRLMGNMTGDHKVLEIFSGFEIPLIPLPLMVLGLLVCVVQTLVFVLLTMVYLSMATAHDDHGEESHAH